METVISPDRHRSGNEFGDSGGEGAWPHAGVHRGSC